MRLLLVEDDSMIGRAVKQSLTQAGHAVDWVADGTLGLAAVANDVYDLVVLDVGLPGLDGLSFMRRLRAAQERIPVLVISARDGVADRIAGLDAGADDYLLKPFDLAELLARVRALLRRQGGAASNVLVAGKLCLDIARRTVVQDGREVNVTAKEFALLEALLRRPGAIVSRERLEESVYGWADDIGSNTVEVHLHNLRRKLGLETIKNVRGLGYRVVG